MALSRGQQQDHGLAPALDANVDLGPETSGETFDLLEVRVNCEQNALLERLTQPRLDVVPADEGAAEGDEGLVEIGPPLVTVASSIWESCTLAAERGTTSKMPC